MDVDAVEENLKIVLEKNSVCESAKENKCSSNSVILPRWFLCSGGSYMLRNIR